MTVKNEAGVRKAGAAMRKKMKMTIAATRAPISGRASSRFDQPRVTRLDASAGAEGEGSVLTGVLLMTAPVLFGGGRAAQTDPTPWRRLASVLLDEREDLGDVRLVDEGGASQHSLATTENVAVLLEEVELGDGHVALQVGLLVDEPLDLAVADRLGRIRVGVERPDLHVGPGGLRGLDRVEGLRRAEGDDPVDRLVLRQLGLDGAGDGGVVGAVDLQVLG